MILVLLIVFFVTCALALIQFGISRQTGTMSGAGGIPIISGLISVGVPAWDITAIDQRSIFSILGIVFAYFLGFVVAGLIGSFRKKKRQQPE